MPQMQMNVQRQAVPTHAHAVETFDIEPSSGLQSERKPLLAMPQWVEGVYGNIMIIPFSEI